jgi:hypothetical protein
MTDCRRERPGKRDRKAAPVHPTPPFLFLIFSALPRYQMLPDLPWPRFPSPSNEQSSSLELIDFFPNQ